MVDFFKILGIASASLIAIVGLIGYLARKILDQVLSKDLEKFKLELQNENQKSKLVFDKQMESYKTKLSVANSRQVQLYTKRSEIIETLYKKLVNLNSSMLNLTALMRNVTGKDEETIQKEEFERIQKAAIDGNDFFDFYQKNKIYFKESTCALIEKIQAGMKQSHSDYSFRYLWGVPPSEMTHEMTKKSSEYVRTVFPDLLHTLEVEFRTSIGVIEEEMNE